MTDWPMFFTFLIGLVTVTIILSLRIDSLETEIATLKSKPQVIIQDDCYVGDDYTDEVLGADKVKQMIERKL